MNQNEKVLLIHPGSEEVGYNRDYPPWGILFIAKELERIGISSSVLDLNGDPHPEDKVLAAIAAYQPTIVGYTAKWGHACRRLIRVLEAVQAVGKPKHKTVVGGPLVGTVSANHPVIEMADQLIVGDGETGFVKWIDSGMPLKEIIWGFSAEPVDLNINGVTPPSAVNLSEYIVPAHKSELNCPALYLSAARGCVGKCTFCYRNKWKHGPFRTVAAKILVDNLKQLQNDYSVNGFYFLDDNLLSNWKWTQNFCTLIAKYCSDIHWGCDIRASEITQAHLDLLWIGGCRALYVGLETFSDTIRTSILGKSIGGKEAFANVDTAIAKGFRVRASIGIGWPNEAAFEMEETLEAVKVRPKLLFDIFCYAPLPGAPLSRKVSATNLDNLSILNYDDRLPNYSDSSDENRNNIWLRFQTTKVTREL